MRKGMCNKCCIEWSVDQESSKNKSIYHSMSLWTHKCTPNVANVAKGEREYSQKSRREVLWRLTVTNCHSSNSYHHQGSTKIPICQIFIFIFYSCGSGPVLKPLQKTELIQKMMTWDPGSTV